MSGTLVGAVTAIGGLGRVIDPGIGRLSDRLRVSFGRRHLPMLVGALASGPLFFAIFSPPDGLSHVGLSVWLLVFGLLLRSAHSLFLVPYYALGAELSTDYQERSTISATRTVFVFTGTLVAVVLSFLLFFSSGGNGAPDAKFQASGYAAMGASLGVLMTGAALAAVFGTLEARERLRPASAGVPPPHLFYEMRDALRQPSYRSLLVSASLFFMGSVANASLTINYLNYYVEIGDTRDISIFQAGFFAGALLGVPLWMRLTHRVDKHHLYSAACLIIALVVFGAYGLVGHGRLIEPGSLFPLVVGHSLAGLAAAALWILPASMLADTIDADELQNGRRREATLFGIYSLGHQIAAGLAIIVTGALLDFFAGLAPGEIRQSTETIERIGMLYGTLPAVIFLAALSSMSGYQLTRCRVSEIQSELSLRRRGC